MKTKCMILKFLLIIVNSSILFTNLVQAEQKEFIFTYSEEVYLGVELEGSTYKFEVSIDNNFIAKANITYEPVNSERIMPIKAFISGQLKLSERYHNDVLRGIERSGITSTERFPKVIPPNYSKIIINTQNNKTLIFMENTEMATSTAVQALRTEMAYLARKIFCNVESQTSKNISVANRNEHQAQYVKFDELESSRKYFSGKIIEITGYYLPKKDLLFSAPTIGDPENPTFALQLKLKGKSSLLTHSLKDLSRPVTVKGLFIGFANPGLRSYIGDLECAEFVRIEDTQIK